MIPIDRIPVQDAEMILFCVKFSDLHPDYQALLVEMPDGSTVTMQEFFELPEQILRRKEEEEEYYRWCRENYNPSEINGGIR